MKVMMIKIIYPETIFLNGIYFRTPVIFEYFDEAAIEHIKNECVQKGYKFEISSYTIQSSTTSNQIQKNEQQVQQKVQQTEEKTKQDTSKSKQQQAEVKQIQPVRRKGGRPKQQEVNKKTTNQTTEIKRPQTTKVETLEVTDKIELKEDSK